MTIDATPSPDGAASAESSRYDPSSSGLHGPVTPGSWTTLLPPADVRPTALSWLNPRVLFNSRNEFVARIHDPVPEFRRRWMSRLSDPEQLVVDLGYGAFSFALLGDTGEGDNSQYALLPSLKAECADVRFLFICSDLIYPAASVEDYLYKFYWPYQTLAMPIYALPGNHDWYDSLDGFMEHLANVRPLPPELPTPAPPTGVLNRVVSLLRRTLGYALWRKAAPADDLEIARMKKLRAAWPQPVQQPGPYYVIDTEHVRLVCVDPGILGNLDAEQAAWLVRVSAESDTPKVLLTGKPLLVDGHVEPCLFLGPAVVQAGHAFRSVLDVVHHLPFGYVAAIGGDVHNYQHYPVRLSPSSDRQASRTIHHVVSGGGGAFMHATHAIAEIAPEKVFGVTEEEFKCYPLRRDSMAVYSTVIDNRWQKSRLGRLLAVVGIRPRLVVTPAEAGLFLRDVGHVPSNGNRPIVDADGASTAAELPAQVRRMCRLLLRLGGGKVFHRMFSPFLDWDEPPFSKNFLRIDVDAAKLTVSCFSVTGALEQEHKSMREDSFEVGWPQVGRSDPADRVS
ncbi:MAG: metallophosphoesterase [Propionibacteriaceae bacterium]